MCQLPLTSGSDSAGKLAGWPSTAEFMRQTYRIPCPHTSAGRHFMKIITDPAEHD
jgi:hypothetical protein